MGACIMAFPIFIIGNRQRVLGNLLHGAHHQNLSARRNLNDWIGPFLLTPALLANLVAYRVQLAVTSSQSRLSALRPAYSPSLAQCLRSYGW